MKASQHSRSLCFKSIIAVSPELIRAHRRRVAKMTRFQQKQENWHVRRSKRQRTAAASQISHFHSSSSEECTTRTDDADADFDPTSESSEPNDDEAPIPFKPAASKKLRMSKSNAPVLTESSAALGDLASSANTQISFSVEELGTIRTTLLDWYVDNHRKLPWRPSPRYQKNGLTVRPIAAPESQSSPGAPYAVWISEVMSQQTRIQVVVEYYKTWIREFPTVQHLARASLDRVNELWAGLGYYRRARFLHEGAQQIVDMYDGHLPEDAASLQKLKGIGRYTAGAISSIAFGHAEPVVDGNVERVLSRLLPALTETPRVSNELSKRYWAIATSCVEDVASPGDFNQALMELGATICKPKNPECGSCPLQSICGAYKAATLLDIEDPTEYVKRYPIKNSRKETKVRVESVMALVVYANIDGTQKFLTLQRPKQGLLANLWEAPNKATSSDRSKEKNATLSELLATVQEICGAKKAIAPERCVEAEDVQHVFSHIRQTLNISLLDLSEGCTVLDQRGTTSAAVPFRWLSRKEIKTSAVSTQMRKVFTSAIERIDEAMIS